ncbi:sporulation-control protein [Bacillus ectoiniformans]|uniref:sporulation protein n=1 Tax=Bacillus ectoiniformans TaxID=1494429 RepID=UPI00195D9E65|nr:sporulation protein [Bacillus ectoiniformans]MBM7649497.1 sporulation-control protein [Bacillus ectoiniformans]
MLKKFLAKFGKGAATVDLRFENRPYFAGEAVNGEVLIQGGEVEQKINSLAVCFMLTAATKQGTVKREVATIPLSGAQSILPKEQKTVPFTYRIPESLPVSRGTISYYFDTQLDIEGGIDRSDVDLLTVEVSQPVQSIFRALGQLGFKEKSDSGKVDQYGQEFAFIPTQTFAGEVNEIELRFALEETGVQVWLEVDCRSGFKEVESKREFFLEQSVLDDETQLAQLLKEYLTETVENPHAYTKPSTYSHYHRKSSGMGGMVGGMAVGILGGVLLSDMLDGLGADELLEDLAEELGYEEEESAEGGYEEEASGGEDESIFDDFFGGGDDDY